MDDIFEIHDFTCNTKFSRFKAGVEAIVHRWHLVQVEAVRKPSEKIDLSGVGWKTKRDTLNYEPYSFDVVYYEVDPKTAPSPSDARGRAADEKDTVLADAMQDLLDCRHDFSTVVSSGHVLANYYGLKEFLVISPSEGSQDLREESIQHTVTSAVYAATCETGCDKPIFVQINEKSRHMYLGLCQNAWLRTCFDTIHLKNTPAKCAFLSGVLDLFKEKVASPLHMTPPVKVSARLTFSLHQALDRHWLRHQPLDFSEDSVEKLKKIVQKHNFSLFPFGAIQDPLREFMLYCSWHGLNEDMLVENDVYSDLDPVTAPRWSVSAKFSNDYSCLTSEFLAEYMKLTACHKPIESVLGSAIGNVSDLTVPLDRLTANALSGDVARLTASLSGASSRSPSCGAKMALFDDDLLNGMLTYLFPDAACDQPKRSQSQRDVEPDDRPKLTREESSDSAGPPTTPGSAFKVHKHRKAEHCGRKRPEDEELDLLLQTCLGESKIAPKSSLTTKLALLLCQLSNSMQSELAFCYVWREFLMELRYRFENGVRIPGLENTAPSLNTCLLNQKIQMLNCCVERKLSRLEERKLESGSRADAWGAADSATDPDEAFFDCVEDTSAFSRVLSSAQGRLRPFDGLTTLLHDQTQLLYIPVTQDPAPFTEDTLQEHTHSLLELGTSEQAALLRTKLQCQSLISDIEAFKAANPACCFQDFLRWYSPKDLSEERDEAGNVYHKPSYRMSISNNLWLESWKSAQPKAVCRQRRLFDDTKEAEKILHWLESLKISEIVRLTLAPLFSVVLCQLWEESRPVRRMVKSELSKIAAAFPALSKATNFVDYDDFRKCLERVEATVSNYRTLRNRLFSYAYEDADETTCLQPSTEDFDSLILDLMSGAQVKIAGGSRTALNRAIAKLFASDVRVQPTCGDKNSLSFPPAYRKEYVLRLLVPRPALESRDCVQRLYVGVKEDEFRAAGAFSDDVQFF